MNKCIIQSLAHLSLTALISVLILFVSSAGASGAAAGDMANVQKAAALSPTETVREFYRQLRQRRFREAFAMSIYKPAIEGLSPQEFDDLRVDFERMAAAVPETVTISGEQISGDTATVFVKVNNDDASTASSDTQQDESITLLRRDGGWIIGDKENEAVVKKNGKDFFFKARIDTHHSEVQSMLQRISVAELIYSQQHNGKFGDLAALIAAGLVPKDLEGTESTGYRFHITLSPDAKGYAAGAEPAQYGRTGRLSFFLDQTGIKSGDAGGKPFVPRRE